MVIFLIYLIGVLVSLFLVWTGDRFIWSKTDKTEFGTAVAMSIGSWITVVMILIAFFMMSDTYEKIDELWKK